MATTDIRNTPVEVIAARATASAAPTEATDGYLVDWGGGRIRTFITYDGAVTAANIRLWVRNPTTDTWHRGMDTATLAALTPADGNDARDWDVGAGAEFVFQLESIAPSGGAPTVAVHAVGVST